MNTVSVIIPAYNAERYIQQSLESALNQSLQASQVLVVNDGSIDGTRDLLKTYSDAICVIENQQNSGRAGSCNRAVELAKGAFIAFLDADDIWTRDHLEVLVGLLEHHENAGLAFSRVQMFGTRNEIWPGHGLPCVDAPAAITDHLLRHSIMIPSATVIRREFFLQLGGFSASRELYKGREVLADDYDLFLRASVKRPFIATDRILTRYRWHEEQSSYYEVPQRIAAIRHAIRMLRCMCQDPGWADKMPHYRDRLRMHWLEILETAWRERELNALRKYVQFGIRQSYLCRDTSMYLWRSCVPRYVVARWDNRV